MIWGFKCVLSRLSRNPPHFSPTLTCIISGNCSCTFLNFVGVFCHKHGHILAFSIANLELIVLKFPKSFSTGPIAYQIPKFYCCFLELLFLMVLCLKQYFLHVIFLGFQDGARVHACVYFAGFTWKSSIAFPHPPL